MQPEIRNLILAAVLSFGVLALWQFISSSDAPPEETSALNNNADPLAPAAPLNPLRSSSPNTPSLNNTPAPQTSQRIAVFTPKLSGSINLNGLLIDDLILSDYGENPEPQSPRIRLLSPQNTPRPYEVAPGWSSPQPNAPIPQPNALWTPDNNQPLTPQNPKSFSLSVQDVLYTITLSVDDNYLFTLSQSVQNNSNNSLILHPFLRTTRLGVPPVEDFYILHEGPVAYFPNLGLEELSYDDLADDGPISYPSQQQGWLGFTDKYWAVILIPPQNQPFNARFLSLNTPTNPQQADLISQQPLSIPPGQSASSSHQIFAGAKLTSLVNEYAEQNNIIRLDLVIDWGWFYFLTKPLFKLLSFLFSLTGSFASAIIIATVLIRLVLFPLANKSFAAMSRMRLVQPKIAAMRELHKNDKPAMQQAMIQLYRTEKINPAAGCLPILVQIPIFFALYKVLFVSIEMRHAPFVGWIHDLSAPDPTSLFNLFGLLPWNTVDFLTVGAWPIFMGLTMAAQMRLSPPPPDPIQRRIFSLMPIIFTFVLARFPAGLVLYWTWNNLLSILQQTMIMRRHGVEIALPGARLLNRKKKPDNNPPNNDPPPPKQPPPQ